MNQLCPKNTVLMYLLLTMCAIVSDIIMYRWLNFIYQAPCMHQKDHPANKQLSPKDAMQAPSYVFDKEQSYQSYHDTTCHNMLAKALCKSACLCLLEHSSTTAQKLSHLLCSAHAKTSVITWYQTFLPALLLRPHGQAITSPITSVLATLHLLLSTMHYVCL